MLARVLRSSVRAVPARSLTTLARSIPASFAVAKKMPSTRYFSVAPESDDAVSIVASALCVGDFTSNRSLMCPHSLHIVQASGQGRPG